MAAAPCRKRVREFPIAGPNQGTHTFGSRNRPLGLRREGKSVADALRAPDTVASGSGVIGEAPDHEGVGR